VCGLLPSGPIWVPEILPNKHSFKGKQIIQLSFGISTMLAVVAPKNTPEDTEVWTWGKDINGILGLGTTSEASAPKVIEELSSKKVIKVRLGEKHAAAVTGIHLILQFTQEYNQLTLLLFSNW